MMTPGKLFHSALWAGLRAAIRCFALSSLVGVHVTAQQVPTPPPAAARAADAIAAHIKISGYIKTPSGVLVPGATVNLVHTETGQAWVTWTDDKGKFELPGLPIGHYRFTVEQLGFEKTVSESDMSVGTKPPEITLKVATMASILAASAAAIAAAAPPPAPAAEKPAEAKTETKADGTTPAAADAKPADTKTDAKTDAAKTDATKKADATKPASPGGGPGGRRNLTPEQLAELRKQRAAQAANGQGGPGGFRRV